MAEKQGSKGPGATPAKDPGAAKTPRASGEPAFDDPAAAPAAASELIDLDNPPPGLPELAFPNSPLREAREAAAERRARRLRVEFIGGGLLLLIGIGVSAATQTVAILVLAILVLGCLVAYELLVSNLE